MITKLGFCDSSLSYVTIRHAAGKGAYMYFDDVPEMTGEEEAETALGNDLLDAEGEAVLAAHREMCQGEIPTGARKRDQGPDYDSPEANDLLFKPGKGD